jgi:hypothetical protein
MCWFIIVEDVKYYHKLFQLGSPRRVPVARQPLLCRQDWYKTSNSRKSSCSKQACFILSMPGSFHLISTVLGFLCSSAENCTYTQILVNTLTVTSSRGHILILEYGRLCNSSCWLFQVIFVLEYGSLSLENWYVAWVRAVLEHERQCNLWVVVVNLGQWCSRTRKGLYVEVSVMHIFWYELCPVQGLLTHLWITFTCSTTLCKSDISIMYRIVTKVKDKAIHVIGREGP